MRPSGRNAEEMRLVKFTENYSPYAEGSVLVEFGNTRVLATATVESRVPRFLKGKGEGWVTAEYGMLPRATHTRNQREAARGKQNGRTLEIQRLIGRSLRAVVDRVALGERTITIDCDVLQADGGTRTASTRCAAASARAPARPRPRSRARTRGRRGRRRPARRRTPPSFPRARSASCPRRSTRPAAGPTATSRRPATRR